MASASALSHEISRILDAPYPCSLQTLHEVLKQVDRESLNHWASGNQCRLRALVPIVLDALQSASCALTILESLALNEHFREAVLESKPLLLETLLRQSIESESGFGRCSATCVNLLSSPSPIAIPAHVSPFLTKLLQNAYRTPCEESIRPIYTILAGSRSCLLDALSPDVVVRMQEQFKKMLQHVKIEIEGNAANLFCLAVLALVSLQQSSISAKEQEPSSPLHAERSTSTVESGHGCQVAQQFFAAKRAPKTIDLVVLKMIYACSTSCKLAKPEIIESLQLSNVILEAIDDADRGIWIAKNEAKVSKLVDKILSYAHAPSIVCPTLQFLVTLYGDRTLPAALSPVCNIALRIPSASRLRCALRSRFLLLLDESSVREHLLSFLQAADAGFNNGGDLGDIEAAIALVESFSTCVMDSAPLRQKILYLISTNTLAGPLRLFLATDEDTLLKCASGDHKEICPNAFAERRVLLRQKICMMFLKTACFSPHDSLSLDPSVASALLDKTMCLKGAHTVCQRYHNINRSWRPASFPIFETGGTPSTVAGSNDWRAHVKSSLTQNAEHQYQTIVRTMGDACRELERRCHEVEGPLREEETKSTRLHNELAASRLRVSELTSRNEEQSLILEGIDQENSELRARLNDLESERDDLSAQTGSLHVKLDQAVEQANNAEQVRSKEVRELELGHAAASAEKDEILEAQFHKEQALVAQIHELEADVAKLRANASASEEEVMRLEVVVTEQRTVLNGVNFSIGEHQDTISRQKEQVDRLEVGKRDLQTEIKDLSDSCGSLRTDVEDRDAAVAALRRELNDMRCEHEGELSAQGKKLSQLAESTSERIREFQALLDKQAEDAAIAVQENDSKMIELESELANSRAELSERDKELEEIQALNEQAMAFWSKARRRNPAAKEAVQPDAPMRTSLTTPGPQHKRTGVKVPRESPQHKRSRTAKLGRNGARPSDSVGELGSCNQGSALRGPRAGLHTGTPSNLNLSPLRISRQKETPKQSWKEKANDENVEIEMGEGSLCDSDFFGSTDQQLMADMHGEAPQFGFNDETTEF